MSDYPDQHLIDELFRKLNGNEEDSKNGSHKGSESIFSDEQVLELCRNAKNAAKFASLFDDGDLTAYDGDDSDADAGLLGIMAFYTQDRDQLTRLWGRSALGQRAKFHRADYRRRTLDFVLGKPIETYGGRDPSSSSHSVGGREDEEGTKVNDSGLVWVSDMGTPDPQEFTAYPAMPRALPVTFYGAGGSAKSILLLDFALRYTNVGGEWLGSAIYQRGRALVVDFELNANVFNDRVRKLARGMDLDPEKITGLAYFCVGDLPPKKALEKVRFMCEKHGFDAVIIDSIGPALEGDATTSKDVLAFHRERISPLCTRGITPISIDHQARSYSEDDYQGKGAYGNSYKEHMARSVFQVQPKPSDDESDTLVVRVRHRKANFTKLMKPFDVWITFSEESIRVERKDVDTEELLNERTLSIESRILAALNKHGQGTVENLVEWLDSKPGTVGNAVTRMKQDGRIIVVEKDGKKPIYGLTDSSSSSQPPKDSEDEEEKLGDDYDDSRFSYITTPEQLTEAVSKLAETTLIGLDLETVGTDPVTGTLRLVQVSDGEKTFVVDASVVDPKPLLESIITKEIIAHNAHFELAWLKYLYSLEPGTVHDTMLMSQVIYAGKVPPHEHGLLEVAKRELGIELDKTEQQSDWSAKELSEEQLNYAALDAKILPELYCKLKEAAKDA